MGIDAKDTDVFQLLQKLKEVNGTYPPDLLAERRQGYVKQVAEIGAGAGLAAALKSTVKTAQGTGTGIPPAASTLLESLLVVAIVVEAGTVTYFYRDRLVDLYNNITKSPKVEEVSNPLVMPSPFVGANIQFTVTPVFTVTGTVTPISTPSLLAEVPTHQQQNGSQSDTNQTTIQSATQSGSPAISTPDPRDDNGNHYGQTPIPARTKEPGNNSNRDNAQNNPSGPNHRP
jgi:hypothetical protein